MPLDTLPGPAKAAPSRFIEERGDNLFLLAIAADGGCDIVGPLTTHEECEQLARTLLSVAAPNLAIPAALHRLCVAYLASRGQEVVA